MVCEPWVVRVWWNGGGARLYYYRNRMQAVLDIERMEDWGSVTSIEGPTHNVALAAARERTILKREVQDIERDIKYIHIDLIPRNP